MTQSHFASDAFDRIEILERGDQDMDSVRAQPARLRQLRRRKRRVQLCARERLQQRQHIVLLRMLAAEKETANALVFKSIEQYATRRFPVASRTAGFLIVTF